MKNRSTRAKTTGTHRKACSQPSILSLEIVVRVYENKNRGTWGERKKNVCGQQRLTIERFREPLKPSLLISVAHVKQSQKN